MIASIIGGFIALVVWLVLAAISLAGLLFWVWMLIDAIRNKSLSDNERIVWVLVIIFVNLLGAVIYFFAGRHTVV